MINNNWLTVLEAAEISGYHSNHLRRLLQSNKINARKWGQAWMVDRESLLEYCEEMESKGEKRGPKKGD